MRHLARPRHLGNVHQAFDAAFQLHEGAVIHQADHLALHTRSDRILFRHGVPWVGSELFHAQGDTFLLGVEFEHDDLDFFADLDDFGGMIDPSPGHVADMENTVDAAEIDEGAVTRDVFNCAFENDALFQIL